MNRFLILLLLTLLTPTLMAFSQNLEVPGPYHWKNRILLVFSPEESTIQEEQVSVFSNNQEGMKDRDLVVFEIKKNSLEHPDGSRYGKESADMLRTEYNVPENQFSVILIGKDGTEKLRKSGVLSAEKLFATIDAMPMRKQEMKDASEK